jgi:cytochrome P450
MSRFCPVYPKPHPEQTSKLRMFWHARRSWMDALFERSYSMQMGEVHLPGVDLYMLNDIKEVKRVMQSEAQQFPKSHLLHESLEPLLGDSIFTTNGEQWQRQRTMMNPAFAQARVNVAFPRMLGAAQSMLERLDAVEEAQPYDIEIEMTHVTADIIFRTIFSTPCRAGCASHLRGLCPLPGTGSQAHAAGPVRGSLADHALVSLAEQPGRPGDPWPAARHDQAAL